MYDEKQTPTLHFFRAIPENLKSRPPLSSSLQSLESCFFLIALNRYPHALVACASAIESAIKAELALSSEEHKDFNWLINQAQDRARRLKSFNRKSLQTFKDTRNQVVHYGFSPKDDAVTAKLLLEVGFRFLDQCYQDFFDFTLAESLHNEFSEQLEIAMEVYDKARHLSDLSFSYCFRVFGHLIRWSVRESFMPYWELEALDEGWRIKIDTCEEEKGKLDSHFAASWFFECPICGETETLVCELDVDELNAGNVSLKRAACPSCGLIIPNACPFLADTICRQQVEQARSEILKEYGISSNS